MALGVGLCLAAVVLAIEGIDLNSLKIGAAGDGTLVLPAVLDGLCG